MSDSIGVPGGAVVRTRPGGEIAGGERQRCAGEGGGEDEPVGDPPLGQIEQRRCGERAANKRQSGEGERPRAGEGRIAADRDVLARLVWNWAMR